jgi:AcrR family transcriptional regulator
METRPAGRMERKKEETHNRIIDAALELFHRQGLEATTMEQIAEAAEKELPPVEYFRDVAKGTLYNYFSAKEAIISAFMQRSFRTQNDERVAKLRALPNTRERMIRIFNTLIDGVRREREIFEVFMVYRMKQVLSFRPETSDQSGLLLLIREIIRLGLEEGDLRRDLPEDLLEDLFQFAFIAAVKPFFLQPETYDQAAAVEHCVEIFLNGAKA